MRRNGNLGAYGNIVVGSYCTICPFVLDELSAGEDDQPVTGFDGGSHSTSFGAPTRQDVVSLAKRAKLLDHCVVLSSSARSELQLLAKQDL